MARIFGVSKLFLPFLLISVLLQANLLMGQENVAAPDSSLVNPDSLLINEIPADSISADTLRVPSDGFFPASIFYDANDSIVFDLVSEKVLLYGQAIVKYESIELRADYIEYDMKNGQACANGLPDSTGVLQGIPVLSDAGQEFSQQTMCYNFKTKRGTSHEVLTNDGELYVHSDVAKRQSNEWVHMQGGKITSCDAAEPHYHFYVSKAVVVPDDKIVSGPVNLRVRIPVAEIEIKAGRRIGTPFGIKFSLPAIEKKTPLFLPFGFFPNKIESSHGIILPGYGDHQTLGFFLQNGGYYFPINENIDTRVLFDVYSRGSWSARNLTSYNKRYRYNGSLDVSRTVTKSGFEELSNYSKQTNFFVRWSHSKDPKSRPNTRFSADVNMGTSNNFRNNLNSSQQDYVNSTFNSSLMWSKSWTGRPYNLSISGRHSQNVTTGNVDITLPSATFSVNRFNLPLGFINRKAVGSPWYEKIGVSYSARFDNTLNSTDKDLRWDRYQQLAGEMRNGIKHTASVSTSLKVLRNYVSITPNFSYSEVWAFREVDRTVDPETQVLGRDTTAAFNSARSWNGSVNATTKVFGLFRFKRLKNVDAMRHVMTPTIGLRYTPYRNFTRSGFFGEDNELQTYSVFDAAAFRPSNTNESGAITFGVQNNLEMKVRDKSADKLAWKKIKILEGFNVSSSYNLLADSLKLANFNVRAFTTIYKNLKLTLNSVLSPYARDLQGRAIDTYIWDAQRKLLRMQSMDGSIRMRFSSRERQRQIQQQSINQESLTDTEQQELNYINSTSNDYLDLTQSWSMDVGYTFNLTKNWDPELLKDTIAIRHAISLNASVNVFRNWYITYTGGYDLLNKDFTPTTVSFYWDLHCWEMAFNWIPFGDRKSYNIQLNVKASMLKDLKLQRRKNYGDQNLLY
ncbi:MAG: hypothetical protein KDC12_04305 [Flavobacteriales bacterium]|nr:hypothetical protein [Flavobacteriales bacterium]